MYIFACAFLILACSVLFALAVACAKTDGKSAEVASAFFGIAFALFAAMLAVWMFWLAIPLALVVYVAKMSGSGVK